MLDIRTGEELSRRDFGKGIAAILAAGCAPSVMGGMMRMTGARNAVMFGGGSKPYDEEVEYLESNGNQYIDTGIIPGINTSVYIDFTLIKAGGKGATTAAFYGSNSSYKNGSSISCDFSYPEGLRFTIGGTENNASGYTFGVNSRIKTYFSRYDFIIGTTSYQVNYSGNDFQNYTAYIFGVRRGSTVQDITLSSIRLHKFVMNGIEFIPCIKNGLPGLYSQDGIFHSNEYSGHQFGYKKNDGTIIQPT